MEAGPGAEQDQDREYALLRYLGTLAQPRCQPGDLDNFVSSACVVCGGTSSHPGPAMTLGEPG